MLEYKHIALGSLLLLLLLFSCWLGNSTFVSLRESDSCSKLSFGR
jgi:hypothetical protein